MIVALSISEEVYPLKIFDTSLDKLVDVITCSILPQLHDLNNTRLKGVSEEVQIETMVNIFTIVSLSTKSDAY